MIVKQEHTYTGTDDSVSYSLIDNVDKTDVGCDENHGYPRNYVNVYLKGRKDQNEFIKLWADDTTIYICNDTGKTLQIVRPAVDK